MQNFYNYYQMWDDIISTVKLVDDDIEGGRPMLQESNRIEFKAELNAKLEKEIVAFLNNKEGGVLYIGVDDNGNPVGMSDIDSMQLKIADRIKIIFFHQLWDYLIL